MNENKTKFLYIDLRYHSFAEFISLSIHPSISPPSLSLSSIYHQHSSIHFSLYYLCIYVSIYIYNSFYISMYINTYKKLRFIFRNSCFSLYSFQKYVFSFFGSLQTFGNLVSASSSSLFNIC